MTKNRAISSRKIESEALEQLEEISGVNIYACYQCGNCSASCPAVEFMDIPPHQVIRLAQLGFIDDLTGSETPWICAACITCTVKCPRGVDIAKVMEGLRQIVLRSDFEHINIREIDEKLREKLPQIALIGNFRKTIL
jgi:heterodisulfide reductase subunit C